MTAIDDAVLCPMLLAHARSGQLVPLLAVQMYPPDDRAVEAFETTARRVGLEPVRGAVDEWRPGRRKPAAKVTVARNGRWTITTAREVIFDDSTAALAPDELDQTWIDTARATGRALLLIGGPAPLQNPTDLDQAAAGRTLIGGWATVTLPAESR